MMEALSQDEIIGKELAGVFCDFDAEGIIALRSGAVFSLPGVLMTEVCRSESPSAVAPSTNSKFEGATVVDLLRPIDLSDVDGEMQESVKLQLSTGICFSLMWCGAGPYLRYYESANILGAHQSFWAEFDLPEIRDWPDIRKWTCADVAEAEAEEN